MNGSSTYRDDLSYDRSVIRVTYSLGQHSGDWATDIGHQLLGTLGGYTPLALPERALDDAVFAFKELKDTKPLERLREFREKRARAIENHFTQTARRLIEDIEKDEGWDVWLDRMR